jgi:riboflavin synthase
MFTGLIETIGTITDRTVVSGRVVFGIQAPRYRDQVGVGDSVSINGVCLTAVHADADTFAVEAVEETLAKTTLGRLHTGHQVNLERALRVGDRLGGHFVLGHIDGVAPIADIAQREGSWLVTVALDADLVQYCIPVGAIAIDGISLTIARLEGHRVTVSIIPHTWTSTMLQHRRTGDPVNVEVDMIGKYVRRFTAPQAARDAVTMEKLRESGFIG